jgi:citrate lyase beta subunit
MIDKPVVTRAERVLDLAKAAGIQIDENGGEEAGQ